MTDRCELCARWMLIVPAEHAVLVGSAEDLDGDMPPVCWWHNNWARDRAEAAPPGDRPWWWWQTGTDGWPTDPDHQANRPPLDMPDKAKYLAPVVPINKDDSDAK